MADISDVEDALVGALATAFYPNGIDAGSVVGFDVFIEGGWPLPTKLEQTLTVKPGTGRAPGVRISVFPPPGMSRSVPSAMTVYSEHRDGAPTLSVVEGPEMVTFTGTGSETVRQNVAIIVHGQPYVIAVEASDTATSVATKLAMLLAADVPGASSDGPVLHCPGILDPTARVGVGGTIRGEIGREQQAFGIYVWASSPDHRKHAARVARNALGLSPRLALPDGSNANLTYRSTSDADKFEKTGIFRRDIQFWVEFATFLEAEDAFEIIAPVVAGIGVSPTP